MLLRARHLFPVTAPPIEDGAVVISGDRLVAVGAWADLHSRHGGPVIDLGEVVLLPGLVNAHCHLDYTHFAAHLPPPRSFSAWIQGVLALKAGWSFSEYAASWIEGARQLVRSGCTTVLDIEAVPELLPEAWASTPLRVISALEMTGVRSARTDAEILGVALAKGESLHHPRNRWALSPHAPYSTRRELLVRTAEAARLRDLLITLHVAESAEELAMFLRAEGPMHQWLQPQRHEDTSVGGGLSPVAYVAGTGLLGPHTLLAHVNYLQAGDAARLGRSGTHVVHCPRSHDYFGHDAFPLAELQAAGVNLCLGTDSLLSVRRLGRPRLELDLFEELRGCCDRHPGLSPEALLALVTSSAARAIGRDGELGELRAGTLADLIAVPMNGGCDTVAGRILEHVGPVTASMIGGVWAVAPPGGSP